MILSVALLLATLFATAAAKEEDGITFSSSLSAEELVENYFRNPEDPVEFRNVAASDHSCFALFTNGHSAGGHSLFNQFLLPNEGILMSTGKPEDFHINDSDETTTDFGITTGDIHLEHNLAQGTQVLDPCFIQFEFSCPETTDIYTPQVRFDYVFGSEEYLQKKKKEEDVEVDKDVHNRGANPDLLGFFLNGENIALVPDENGGVAKVSIEDVNEKKNTQYFVSNKFEDSTSLYSAVEADGFTTKLTASGTAKPGWNIVKLAIGDVADGNLDSWVLLEAGTFSCFLGSAPQPKPYVPPTKKKPNKEAEETSVAYGENESEASKKISGVGVFFIVLAVIVVGVWVLLATGAMQVKRVPEGNPSHYALVFNKPNTKPSEIKAKSVEMFGTMKAKSREVFGKAKAKSSEKFGSKKVKPTESSTAPSKVAEQKIMQSVGQPAEQASQSIEETYSAESVPSSTEQDCNV